MDFSVQTTSSVEVFMCLLLLSILGDNKVADPLDDSDYPNPAAIAFPSGPLLG